MYKQFHNYKIYDTGKIFSDNVNRFMKFDWVQGYAQVYLSIDGKQVRYKVHRLIAYFFCDPPENYCELVVDHLDGDPKNNNSYNLEWVTMSENNKRARQNKQNDISLSNHNRWLDDDFRSRTAENISRSRLENQCNKGSKNGRYRFKITDISGRVYIGTELCDILHLSLAAVYKKIKKFMNGSIVKEFQQLQIVSIIDLKDEVNRLSKAKEELTSENKTYYKVRAKRVE